MESVDESEEKKTKTASASIPEVSAETPLIKETDKSEGDRKSLTELPTDQKEKDLTFAKELLAAGSLDFDVTGAKPKANEKVKPGRKDQRFEVPVKYDLKPASLINEYEEQLDFIEKSLIAARENVARIKKDNEGAIFNAPLLLLLLLYTKLQQEGVESVENMT